MGQFEDIEHLGPRGDQAELAASVGAKGFSGVCTLVQVPLALHYLGTEAYGFWITLFSIIKSAPEGTDSKKSPATTVQRLATSARRKVP